MQNNIEWLSFEEVSELHQCGLDTFGGLPGVRDENALYSALDAPYQLHAYEGERNILRLAIRLCARLCANHPFSDGNKRVALSSMELFLNLNGYEITPNIDEILGYPFTTEENPEPTYLSYLIRILAGHGIGEAELYEQLKPHLMLLPDDLDDDLPIEEQIINAGQAIRD